MRPLLHTGNGAQHLGVQRHFALVDLAHAVQAQIAGAAFQARNAQRHAQRLHQPWQVTQIKLILQGLGGGGDHHALAAQQGRHQIGKSLAHARAGFSHQHATTFNGGSHG